MRQANVRIVAISWPVCQTPPRVVTHRIWVEKPNRIVSASRSNSAADADPAEEHPAQPDAAGGEHRVDPRLDLVRADRPEDRDERHQTTAGNGANGT